LFFQAIRQHRWDDTLPGTAAFYPGDTPPVPAQVSRQLAEYVMTQVESPASLDRWPNPAGRLVTLILTRCGLRISSALALDFGCLLHDGQQAPYLRYFNTKMKREAAVPIDEELQAAIHEQQRHVLDRWPDGTTCLFPRPHANVSGNLPLMATQTLPNGYCGLPVQKSCPHANACLTCPVFLSGPGFLPELREQRHRTLALIDTSGSKGQTRVLEMNQQVHTNLDHMISEIEKDQEKTADAG
jgi:hypothetical protein